MPSFFADSDWFVCTADDRPCVSGSGTRRQLQFVDFDPLMPGFLRVMVNGHFAGYGYSITDGADPGAYKLYFFESLASGETIRYSATRVFQPTAGRFQVEGKFRTVGVAIVDGIPIEVTKDGDADDWTANRPTN